MFYFIPSWTTGQRPWQQETPIWYRVFERLTFDDTVSQIRMFQLAGRETGLISLTYNPQLRYFLHKQGLLGTPVWSFFDRIQNIQRKEPSTIDFKALNWPAGTQFLYTPFLVLAKKQGQVFAEIQFAEDGNLLLIDMKVEEQLDKRYLFDDRGFLSSILYFENGQPDYQDYLNEAGVWQVREWLSTGSALEINPEADLDFQYPYYFDWEHLMAELLPQLAADQLLADATLVVASSPQQNELILEHFPQQKKVFSLSKDRQNVTNDEAFIKLLEAAAFLVTDGEALRQNLLNQAARLGTASQKIKALAPFDSRLRLGRSQTIKELIIYFLVDGLVKEELAGVLDCLLAKMADNPLIRLQLVTYDPHRDLKSLEQDLIARLSSQHDVSLFMGPVEDQAENQLPGEESLELKTISFHKLTNEHQVIACLDRARLVVDLSWQPHPYTQIASISAGIPQINRLKTDYVTHQENGWILEALEDLASAIDYYFQGLTNWNRALVAAVHKMTDYTSGRLVEQWENLLEEENDQ